MSNINFWFSFFSLLIPISGGLFFLSKWIKTKQKNQFLLLFGLCLLSIQLFKLPNVLINAGFVIPQHFLNPYFLATLLLYLLGFYFLVKGYLNFAQISNRVVNWIFLVVAILLVIYYFISFFVPKTSLPVWPGHILFFIPAQLTTLIVYYKTVRKNARLSSLAIPNFFILMSNYLLFVTSIAYIYTQTGPLSHMFWYAFVTLSWGISVLQILAYTTLFLGLYFLTRKKALR
jgi:hypothetical protein